MHRKNWTNCQLRHSLRDATRTLPDGMFPGTLHGHLGHTSINTAEMADWKQKSETEFREWFDQLQALLDGNTAASLAKKLLELQKQVDILNQFSSNLENEYTVYQKLYDNGYRTYGDVLDSSDAPITDSNLDTVIGRTYSSDLLRDYWKD